MKKQKGVSTSTAVIIVLVVILLAGAGWYYFTNTNLETEDSKKQAEETEDISESVEKDTESKTEKEIAIEEEKQTLRKKYLTNLMEERMEGEIEGNYVLADLWDETKKSVWYGKEDITYGDYEILSIENTGTDPYEFVAKVKIEEYKDGKKVDDFIETQTWVDSGGLTKYKMDKLN